MAEPVYGAFGNILNLDDEGVDPIVYNVYQTQSQKTGMSDQDIQNLYGTSQMPVFEWVKKIQTGQRTYNPQDAFERDLMEEYERLNEAGQVPSGFMTPQEIMAQQALQGSAGQLGMSVGKSIGAELTNPYATGDTFDKITSGLMKTGQDTAIETINPLRFSELSNPAKDSLISSGLRDNYVPELATREAAAASGNLAQYDRGLETGTLIDRGGVKVPTDGFGRARNASFGDEATGFPEGFDPTLDSAEALKPITTVPEVSRLGTVTDRLNPFTDAGSQNLVSSGVGAGVNFVGRIAAGQDIDDAARSAADAGVIQYATTALLAATPLAPFATIIGGVVGGFLGRVICNELMRQGIMDRKQVILDYKFTRDYLTPTHVAGYHVWAVWMVKQMRKGRLVKLWSHIAGHRANEIAYIYGERDKPDYLGKLYRKILEPICWTVGTFCKETDWSILYRKKEI
jgi:hypothetical protein